MSKKERNEMCENPEVRYSDSGKKDEVYFLFRVKSQMTMPRMMAMTTTMTRNIRTFFL